MTADRDFCRFLSSGLVYQNFSTHFSLVPCCFYKGGHQIPSHNSKLDIIPIRQEWVASDVENTCRICLTHEQTGQASLRQASFDVMPVKNQQIQNLTVSVSRQCNLACASCGSDYSSFWHQENVRHGVIESAAVIQLHEKSKRNFHQENFLAMLAQQDLSLLTYVKFGGGEPLMDDTHLKVLDMIPCPEKVTLHYTSNFSIMPSVKAYRIWEKFGLVKWLASVDGVGERFELLRWPMTWQTLEKNIVCALDSVPGNVMFGVEHTLNPLNVYYYAEIESWFQANFASNRSGDASDFNLHDCGGVMGLDKTPEPLKQLVYDSLGSDHKVSQMLQHSPMNHDIGSLIRHLDQLDAWRGHRWREIFPEVEVFFRV